MKKFIKLLLLTIVSLLITSPTTFADGEYKLIERSNGDVYKVKRTGDYDHYRYDVLLPNGKEYYKETSGNTTTSGGDDLTETEREEVETAIELYEIQYLEEEDDGYSGNLAGILLIVIGLFSSLAPKAAWWLEIGWKLDDVDPSELALVMNRVVGILLIFIGVIMLF
jgi:hypothetical protein